MENYRTISKGVVKRSIKREIAIFIDGTGLDLAAERIKKKIDYGKLIQSLSSGLTPTVCRYYTLLPFEDDSRHRAYLDALEKNGIQVVVKRLPPKTIHRIVNVYPEMASDMVAFTLGHNKFSTLGRMDHLNPTPQLDLKTEETETPTKTQKIVVVVCPNRDLSYPILLAKELGADTISADFGEFVGRDVLKNAAKWIDLSDSETIWRE